MKTILLDVGNHRIKMNRLSSTQETGYLDDASLNAWLAGLNGREEEVKLIISSVRGEVFRRKLSSQTENWIHPPYFLSITDVPGFNTTYLEPETMGIDRVLAIHAAIDLEQGRRSPMLVIDAGTVVTIDHVDRESVHTGGMFFPGLHSIRGSISRDADRIAPVICDNVEMNAGRSTRQCICSGTLTGWLSAVTGIIDSLSATGDCRLFVCGGDASLLLEYRRLKSRLVHVPDLVLDGMGKVALNILNQDDV